MEQQLFLQWAESQKLIEESKKFSNVLKRIYKECLNAKKEELLIVCDSGYPESRVAPIIGLSYYFAALELGLKPRLISQAPKLVGDEASKEVVSAFEYIKEGSIVVMALSHKLGNIGSIGQSYRKYVADKNCRFISTPSLANMASVDSFIEAINIDYVQMHKKALYVKEILDHGKEIRITTAKGTDLCANIRKKVSVANDGMYTQNGSGGNIPAGEVYLAPKKRNVEGVVVVDGTVSHHWGTCLAKNPMKLLIEAGKVIAIEGGKEAELLEKTLTWASEQAKYPWGIRYIGEIGIGMNPAAKIVGSTIIDEKVLGTAHVALGSNYWFGGKIHSIIHLDQVFRDPKIFVDDELLKI